MLKIKNTGILTADMAGLSKNGYSNIQGRYSSHFFELTNGPQLNVVSFPGISTVSLKCFVFVGSACEGPLNNGISHFLEHMLFRGNSKLGDAAQMSIGMEKLGGEFNAATSFDLTEYWFDFHRDYLDEGIEKFCQLLQYPLFEQIEIERSIILEEIIGDYNDDNLLIDLDSLSADLLWPEHPIGQPVIGSNKTIKEIKRSDLIEWHTRYYQPSNMVLGITGDVDAPAIFHKIASHFPENEPKKRPAKIQPVVGPSASGNQVNLVFDKDNQFGFQWTFPVYGLTKTLRIEYELIQRVLDDGNSSRLQRLIREEKGLVYDISSDNLFFDSGMLLTIQSVVGINRLKELISTLVELVKKLVRDGITLDELELAKLRYKAALECNGDSAQGVLYNSLMPALYPCGCTYEEILPKLKEITIDDINLTLKKLLNQNQTTFAMVGPWDEGTREMVEEKLQPWINGRKRS
jgi:predicted Zn-dependent peptidase